MGVALVVAPIMLILCLLPLVYFWFSFKLSRYIAKKYGMRFLAFVFGTFLFAFPFSIFYASWTEFIELCSEPAYLKHEEIEEDKPVVFAIINNQNASNRGRALAFAKLLKSKQLIKGYEKKHKKNSYIYSDLKSNWNIVKELNSEYSLELAHETPNYLFPWVWLDKLMVYRRSDGVLIGESQEAVFGRGIIRFYIYILGDLNNSERSCGYIDNTPHNWRHYYLREKYRAKDVEFFEALLGRNSEKEANVILKQAIESWSLGNIEEAESKFNLIQNKYTDTDVAEKSIVKRAQLKNKYKSENDVENIKRRNRGTFSIRVIQSIDRYFNKNNSYPISILEIDINDYDYLSMCEYTKALFKYGYQLDCNKAEVAIRNEKLTLKNKLDIASRNNIKFLNNFPKAKSTWGNTISPLKKVPKKGFYAFYLNTKKPNQIIKRETVVDIKIKYSFDEFYNIRSQDFNAYWVGNIHFSEEELISIKINQNWSKTRLIIDGHIVYSGGSDKEILMSLAKGDHLIEVEYVNNWHTTKFSLSFTEKVGNLDVESLGIE